MNEKISQLITFIVCFASEQDIRLTTLRLVKFLYLADLFHARWNEGITYTKMPWAFVYYGPYCSEAYNYIEATADKGLINKQTYESKYEDSKDYSLFSCHTFQTEDIETGLPIEVTSGLKDSIKKYGDDTAKLLDYVYFDTEPMEDVKKGDILDFSKTKRPHVGKNVQIKKLTDTDLNIIKKHLKLIGDKFKSGRSNIDKDNFETKKWKDSLYYNTIDSIDDEDLPEGLKGTARITD